MTITEKAIKEIRRLIKDNKLHTPLDGKFYLRASYIKNKYDVAIAFYKAYNDVVLFEYDDIIVISRTVDLLKNVTIDYEEGILGKGFIFINPDSIKEPI